MAQPPQPIFGLVPAGQAVITLPTETPSPTSGLYAIPSSSTPGAKPFSHLVVFMLPGVALPPNTAAAIYLVTPDKSAGMKTRFLGGIGPGKESAIFNLGPQPGGNVVIGVCIEPAMEVARQMEEKSQHGALVQKPKEQKAPSTLALAQRIIKNAFNFLASFSGKAGQVEVVPLKAFEEWWRKFETRLRTDPGFLEREEE